MSQTTHISSQIDNNRIDSIIHARWIIPVEPDETIYENHSLVIHNGKILDVLPTERCIKKYHSQTIHNLTSHALIPG
ncbi:MAG: hypothetical protein OQL19_18660, partial [Gammaproteobacteria bacterium]|nr:hypothetical protein [Gammaproteobacteria bacterium]